MKPYTCQPEKFNFISESSLINCDLQNWERGMEESRRFYQNLDPQIFEQLNRLLDRIMQTKWDIMTLVAQSGSLTTCGQCGGKCCLFGKYHPTLLDIIAMFHKNKSLPNPDFNKHPSCPYSDQNGCILTANFRPTACIIFNCELLEANFTETLHSSIEIYEHKLRQLVSESKLLFPKTRVDRPFLLWIADKL